MFGSKWRDRIDANQKAIARNQAIIATNQVALHTKLDEVARLIASNDKIESRKLEHIMTQTDDLVAAANDLKAAADKEIASLSAIETKLANSPVSNDPVVASVIEQLKQTRDNLTTAGAAADAIVNPPAGGST